MVQKSKKGKGITAVYLPLELKKRVRIFCAINDVAIQTFYQQAIEDRLKKCNVK